MGDESESDIGHVHLKVSDLDRAIRFYEILGMRLHNRIDGAAFLAFGQYHHHVALNTWQSAGQMPPPETATGLYHFAIRYAKRSELAAAVKHFLDSGGTIESSSDCGGIADSVYVRDPDSNGVELTWDRPRDSRPSPLPSDDSPLDIDQLLTEAS